MKQSPLPQESSGASRTWSRVARHIHWGRTQGIARLIEEDDLNPATRIANSWMKWRWRRTHHTLPGTATAVFVVGVQRSGTNMVVRGLETSPEFEVHNENDRSAFARFQLRDDATIQRIVEDARQPFVLFKPLCDSHRTDELLDRIGAGRGRALWIYRHYSDRVLSAVEKFGDVNRRVLSELASGVGTERWQAQRLAPATLTLLRSFDWDTLSANDGAALFWYARNALFFDRGFDARPDVRLVSYDTVLLDPTGEMVGICEFLGFPFAPRLVEHMGARPRPQARPELHPKVIEVCDALQTKLDEVVAGRASDPQRPS